MNNKKFMERVFVPVFLIALCIFFWTQLAHLPEPRFEPMGAALFPKIILGSIIFLTVLDVILTPIEERRQAKAEQAGQVEEKPQEPAPEQMGTPTSIWVPIIASLGFIFYLLLISYTDIHYSILTFLFITLECWYLGKFTKRALLLSILTSICVTAFIHVTFGILMETILP